MMVRTIALNGFRNYDGQTVCFDPGVNVIYGENAQGKTNLLEAVAYLSLGRSVRARSDRELIGWEREGAVLTAEAESRSRDFVIEARLARGVRRRLTINGVACKNGGELGQVLRTVFFCPDDLNLIKEGAAARRRFLDNAICQLRPRYAAALSEYGKLYEQKTRILRDFHEKPSLLDTLDDYNLQLCRTGAVLLHYRAHFVTKLSARAREIHRDFSGGREALAVQYRTVSNVEDPLLPTQQLLPLLQEHMQRHRAGELAAGQCLSGVHKDDLEVSIDGRAARQFASQGQTRTAALSLKLAERELQRDDTGAHPVLLLDDVLSELDRRRQEFVLSRIGGGQVMITCCDKRGLEAASGRLIQIVRGAVV